MSRSRPRMRFSHVTIERLLFVCFAALAVSGAFHLRSYFETARLRTQLTTSIPVRTLTDLTTDTDYDLVLFWPGQVEQPPIVTQMAGCTVSVPDSYPATVFLLSDPNLGRYSDLFLVTVPEKDTERTSRSANVRPRTFRKSYLTGSGDDRSMIVYYHPVRVEPSIHRTPIQMASR